jgi:Fe-S cluster assembly protein SufD
MPDRRHEDWKYSAKKIGDLSTFDKALDGRASDISRPYKIDKKNALSIRLENGAIATPLDNLTLPEGLILKRFTHLNEEEIGRVIEAVGSESKKREFEQINLSSFDDGLYIEASRNSKIEQMLILEIVHNKGGVSLPRIFVNIRDNAELTVIEEFHCTSSDTALCISHSDYLVAQNSQLNSLRMNLGFAEHKLIASSRAQLKRDARFNSDALCLGAQLGRHDLRVLLQEPGAECDLNGIVVTQANQHFDNHTCIEHIAPHCTSNENYRCIADGKSQIVFNGRIHIVPDAQKTLGTMNNNNLILSPTAEIDSKPELEIYADDVKCAHGTTIGQLDEEEIYYLKTRGLTDEQARQMLTLGFVLKVVRNAKVDEIADFWETILSNLLSFQD